jgi:hypothetical protein
MDSDADLHLACRKGAVLRTRDRRRVSIHHIDPADGSIHGEVEMHGGCLWRADGRFRDAPFGAAGPLDLVLDPAGPHRAPPQTVSMKAVLGGPRVPFCCD